MRTAALFLSVLLASAACSTGGPILTHQNIDPLYGAGQFAYAGAGRDLRVDVVGDPFGGDPAAFGRIVTDAMQGRHFGPATNFTTTPGADARSAYRVVMLFDPSLSLNPALLCSDPPSSLPVQGGQNRVSVFAAFCRGGKSLTSVKGGIASASGPEDPEFRELVGRVTHALFPPDRRADPKDRCPPLKVC